MVLRTTRFEGDRWRLADENENNQGSYHVRSYGKRLIIHVLTVTQGSKYIVPSYRFTSMQ